MNSGLQAVCGREAPCKCCGALALLYGVVDFHKNCEIYRRRVLDLCGIPIYYYRCPVCHFIFTTAFDDFTNDDFQHYIYNEEYLLVDPDYPEARPRANAAFLCRLFPGVKPRSNPRLRGRQRNAGRVAPCRGFSPGDHLRPVCAQPCREAGRSL